MRSRVRRKLEAMERVRDFLLAHPFSEPSHRLLSERFDAMLARAQALAVEEVAGRLDAAAAARHRQALRKELHTRVIRYLIRVAKVAAREQPDLAGRFRPPSDKASHAAFLARGWALMTAAREHAELLAAHGVAGSQIDALASTLTRFEEATERVNGGRRTHVGARAGLVRVAGDLGELALALDPLVRTVFEGDAGVLAAWDSARNLEGPSRPGRQTGVAEGPPQSADELGRAA